MLHIKSVMIGIFKQISRKKMTWNLAHNIDNLMQVLCYVHSKNSKNKNNCRSKTILRSCISKCYKTTIAFRMCCMILCVLVSYRGTLKTGCRCNYHSWNKWQELLFKSSKNNFSTLKTNLLECENRTFYFHGSVDMRHVLTYPQ